MAVSDGKEWTLADSGRHRLGASEGRVIVSGDVNDISEECAPNELSSMLRSVSESLPIFPLINDSLISLIFDSMFESLFVLLVEDRVETSEDGI